MKALKERRVGRGDGRGEGGKVDACLLAVRSRSGCQEMQDVGGRGGQVSESPGGLWAMGGTKDMTVGVGIFERGAM